MDASSRPSLPASSPSSPANGGLLPAANPKPPALTATNSWARRTILLRAREIGLASDVATQVGNVALWNYNRLLLRLVPKGSPTQELSSHTNRYLVPITLALACESLGHAVELDRLLRLSGTPSRKTIETAHELLAKYARMLPVDRSSPPRPPAPRSATPDRPGALPMGDRPWADRVRPRVSPSTRPASPKVGSAAGRGPAVTALAESSPTELERLRQLLGDTSRGPLPPASRPRQLNTNNWARKRITDLGRSLALPERVRRRALELYERIVDLHSARGHAPPGKRLQLSPRLNWSLVYATLYLSCRYEEYPKDLRAIMGRQAQSGSLREIYRLYRLYKRELKLPISIVDVKTLLLSWIDGFELSELLNETGMPGEATRVRERAVTIAGRARAHSSLKRTSTKLIAAGALTTALAERSPPGPLSKFYQAIANFLHMSEETIRLVASRVAGIL